ncbi:protein FAM45A, putative [Pediculus humanus corporis]|uniref:Protein FAM45A, putative n=1 Tax=Pediculus humanus subsp. corporis TaxID=121224 RepID=E0VHZ8_PEDHC|nr:protein FAM45A, putative [Pediculus humanus corporis]EEB13004.1 protein FAM45A, putative [Pediculus humanus corporis]
MSTSDFYRCCVIEKDINNETLLVWAFPSVTPEQKKFILRKYSSNYFQEPSFAFTRYHNEWCYIIKTQIFTTDNLPQVKQYALTLWTKDYNPKKYETLCKILCSKYCKSGNPAELLQLYLSVMTKGVCPTEKNGMFVISNYDSMKIDCQGAVKELIKLFGLEIILIYNSLLLNKRMIIYHHSLESLLKYIQAVPQLMIHRNFNETTFPWLDLQNDELNELKCYEGFIAGCPDKSIEALKEVYDIFVNIPAREVTVSPHSKDYFVMTKVHKDIALFMVQLSENSNMEENEIIEKIAKKTEELRSQFREKKKNVFPYKIIEKETFFSFFPACLLQNQIWKIRKHFPLNH